MKTLNFYLINIYSRNNFSSSFVLVEYCLCNFGSTSFFITQFMLIEFNPVNSYSAHKSLYKCVYEYICTKNLYLLDLRLHFLVSHITQIRASKWIFRRKNENLQKRFKIDQLKWTRFRKHCLLLQLLWQFMGKKPKKIRNFPSSSKYPQITNL